MKKFLIILLVVILLATVGILGYKTNGFKEWNFDNNESTEDVTDDDSSTIIGDIDESGVLLQTTKIPQSMFSASGISEDVESAYTLTATITPNGATYNEVDWDIYFVDSSSTWATSKDVDDYVTITPTSDGALTATVECFQPFGEQIEVKVTSRDNASATATCSVDYLEKLISANIAFNNVNSAYTSYTFNQNNTSNLIDFAETYGPPYSATISYDKTVGTIADEYTTTVSYSASDDLYSDCVSAGVSFTKQTSTLTANGATDSDIFSQYMFNNIFFTTVSGGTWSYTSYRAKIATVLNDYETSKDAIKLTVKTVGTTDTYYSNYTFSIDPDSIAVHVNGVTLDESELVF